MICCKRLPFFPYSSHPKTRPNTPFSKNELFSRCKLSLFTTVQDIPQNHIPFGFSAEKTFAEWRTLAASHALARWAATAGVVPGKWAHLDSRLLELIFETFLWKSKGEPPYCSFSKSKNISNLGEHSLIFWSTKPQRLLDLFPLHWLHPLEKIKLRFLAWPSRRFTTRFASLGGFVR